MSDTSLLYTIFAVDKASMINDKVGSSVNKLALGIGIAAAAIAVKTTSMAANFQSSMLRVQTGAGELKSNMALVSNGVLDLAAKTGDSSKELATALYTVESGGQHGAAGLLVLKAAAQGAKAEGADLNTVADATTSVLQDYHLKASSAALVTSQLVAATGQGKTTFEQLAGSLSAVLPIASAAHISLGDVTGAIASMTVHGMSAEQASQNLADAIRHMQAPTMTQVKAMNQLGISSSDVTDKLGSRGITGTLQYLSTTILTKMGPSGKVLLGTFNQSAQAAANIKTMVASMPAPMQALAHQFQAGTITSKEWTMALKALSPEQANQMAQFATLQKRSSGFSDAIKAGTPAAESYTAALRQVTGDATGLNVALMLTGENTAYTNNAVSTISKTTQEAGNNVKGWSEIQATFNVRMAEAKQQIEVTGIRIGTTLLPYMTKLITVVGQSVGWLTKHKTVAKDVGIAIGALAAAVLLYKTYQLAATAVDKIATGLMLAKRAVMFSVTAAQWAWNVAQGAGNTVLWTWIGVQALDFAAWVRKIAVISANTVALVAYTVATTAIRIATETWTVIQWALNAAFIASPIGWIVLGIAALIAIIVLIATKTTWFQTAWHAVWGAIMAQVKGIAAWFEGPFVHAFTTPFDWVKKNWPLLLAILTGPIGIAVLLITKNWDKIKTGVTDVKNWIVKEFNSVVSFFSGMGAKVGHAAAGMWDGIPKAFKSAINSVIRGWNGLHFSIPSVNTHIPGVGSIGGFTLSTPNIPYLAAGGSATRGGMVVVGDRGPETMFMPAGASVSPDGGRAGRSGHGGGLTLVLNVIDIDKKAVKAVQEYVRTQFGGDVVVALQGHVG